MGIVYWDEDSESFQIATSMQAIAIDPALWEAYFAFGPKGRAVFQQCAADSIEWSFDTVIAYAESEDNPAPPTGTPTPTPTPPPTPPPQVATPSPRQAAPSRGPSIRARGKDEDTGGNEFIAWMQEHTQLVAANSGSLGYDYGPRRELKGKAWKAKTISVSVTFTRGGKAVPGRGLSFVFHYHPGVTGPGVGNAEGSKWHFKPFDEAKTWVRLPEHKFGELNSAMVKRVKEIARGK